MSSFTSYVDRSLFATVGFVVLILAIFVGDFEIATVKIAPYAVVAGAVLFWSMNPQVDRCFLATFLVFGIFLLADIPKVANNEYYAAISIILTFPLLYFAVFKFIEANSTPTLILSFVVTLSFFLVLASAGASIGTRTSVVFGPNVMYRVAGAFLAVFAFAPIRANRVFLNLLRLVGSALAILIMLYTGSRGAIILLAFIVFLFIYSGRVSKKIVVAGCLGLFVPVVLYGLANIEKLAASLRLLQFDFDGESIRRRLEVYAAISDFMNLGVRRILFGYPDFVSFAGLYPHNIFLEALYAHGLLFLILSLTGFFIYFKRLPARLRDAESAVWVEMPLVSVFIGSLVSGDFYDNYAAVCLAFIGVHGFCSRKVRARS